MDQCTAFAVASIATATNEDRLLFKNFVYQAYIDIGPNKSWLHECVVPVEDLSIKKPSDLSTLVDMALYNANDCEVPYTFHPSATTRIHVDRFLIHSAVTQQRILTRIDVAEDAWYFNLGSNGSIVSYAKLRYLALPTDKNGDLLIPDYYQMAMMLFCRWMWSMRKNDNRSEIDQNRTYYQVERDKVKGKNKMPSPVEARAIQAAWMSLFNNGSNNKYAY